MAGKLHLVTGASGLLGSRIVEQLLQRGDRVRALIRPSSDTRKLIRPGVELYQGELTDRESLRTALRDVSTVYHCAARLGDWGPWKVFEAGIVQTTRPLVQACQEAPIERLVHISSVAAYGHPRGPQPWSEAQPLAQNLWYWDYYAKAKSLSEQVVRELGERVVVIRPTWIYGPGDRTILPRIIQALQARTVKILGQGDNRLNLLHVDDVADGVVRAGTNARAAGKTYNLCSRGELTQQEFYALLCEQLQIPAVTQRVPIRLAHAFGFACEALGRASGRTRPPRVTRHGMSLLLRPTCFSTVAAEQELQWQPRVEAAQGLRETVRWLQAEGLA